MKKAFRYGILALCALAVGALLLLPAKTDAPEESTSQPSAATGAVRRREEAYQRDLTALQGLLADESADEDARKDARAALTKMIDEHQTELALTAALEQAGYAPCLVVSRGGGVTVTAGRERLTDEDAARILSVCLHHAKLSPESIRIMAGDVS